MTNVAHDTTKSAAMLRRQAPSGGSCDYYQSRTGRRIRYWVWAERQSPRRGTILLMPGRAEFIEKHFETIRDLLSWGFAVVAFDWRNQGLSGRSVGDVRCHHIKDFDQLTDDLADLLSQPSVGKCPRPLFALAHSMGGFVFLKFLQRYPAEEKIFAGAVLCAPMLGLKFAPFPEHVARWLIERGLKKGKAEQFAPFQRPYGKHNHSEKTRKRLTSDVSRFQDEAWHVERNPSLAVGGVTYGWLDAALKGLAQLFSSNLPERLTLPILFVLAGHDQVVDNKKTRNFISRMRSPRVVTLEEARHEILKENDMLRSSFLKLLEDFISPK